MKIMINMSSTIEESEKLEQFIGRIEQERKLKPMIGCLKNIESH